MTNPNPRAGADFERRVKRSLEGLGLLVIRSAGSHGKADLAAFLPGGGPPLLIQAKRSGKLLVSEWNEFFSLAKRYATMPVLASRDSEDRSKLAFFELTARRPLRSIDAPPMRRLKFVREGDDVVEHGARP